MTTLQQHKTAPPMNLAVKQNPDYNQDNHTKHHKPLHAVKFLEIKLIQNACSYLHLNHNHNNQSQTRLEKAKKIFCDIKGILRNYLSAKASKSHQSLIKHFREEACLFGEPHKYVYVHKKEARPK